MSELAKNEWTESHAELALSTWMIRRSTFVSQFSSSCVSCRSMISEFQYEREIISRTSAVITYWHF